MYAVIRSGGKQYRVAPGDVIRVETQTPGSDGKIEFNDVLAVSGGDGQIRRPPSQARVVGQLVEQGRADKVLVFHYKRKKQYKKIAGHRQPFSAVRITEVAFDGQSFTAPEPSQKEAQPKKGKPAVEISTPPKAEAKAVQATMKKKAAPKKGAAKKPGPKKKK
jgi:large subunit ribosomal protein L21